MQMRCTYASIRNHSKIILLFGKWKAGTKVQVEEMPLHLLYEWQQETYLEYVYVLNKQDFDFSMSEKKPMRFVRNKR